MYLYNAIAGVFQPPALNAALWGLASSFALCVLLVLTKPWHGALTMDFTDGIQKFHTAPTPRIGGIPIVLGLLVACGKATPDIQGMLKPLLIAGMPAFIFGVAEDITKRVGVMQRLLGLQIERDEKACNLLVNEPWHRMREKVMDDLLNAPALQKGGVLFAHVPLPHPPAAGRGSLAVHYARNVQQAEQLLGKILDRLDVNKLEPRILIFSDHPLRPTMWCANRAALFDSPCKVTPELQDDHVPLIAAARSGLPAIEHVQSNQQVFDVLRDWLQH